LEPTRSSKRLTEVLSHIEQNLDSQLDLESVADVSHWSRWQLQRVFKEKTGLSVAQYIRHLRLSQSASHLIGSSARHLDIAVNAGFESEASFTRTFKSHFGCTPRDYRKRGIPEGIRFPLTNTKLNSIRLEKRPAFSIIGTYNEAKGLFYAAPDVKKQAPIVWHKVKQLLKDSNAEHSKPFAVLDISRQASKYITYWVGVEEFNGNSPPEFSTLNVPEQLYAVITHRGSIHHLFDTVAWFIARWLVHSPYRAYAGFEIEEYIEFDETMDQFHIDYWVPIKPVNMEEILEKKLNS